MPFSTYTSGLQNIYPKQLSRETVTHNVSLFHCPYVFEFYPALTVNNQRHTISLNTRFESFWKRRDLCISDLKNFTQECLYRISATFVSDNCGNDILYQNSWTIWCVMFTWFSRAIWKLSKDRHI